MAMMLALKATKPPVLDVVPSTASFSAPGQMGVYVLDSNKEATLAFTLGMVSKLLLATTIFHCTLLSDMALFPVLIPVSVSCSTGPGNRTKSVKQSMFPPSCHLQYGKSLRTMPPSSPTLNSTQKAGHELGPGNEAALFLASFPGQALVHGNEAVLFLASFPDQTLGPGNEAALLLASFPGQTLGPGNEAALLLASFPGQALEPWNEAVLFLASFPDQTLEPGNEATLFPTLLLL